ncbi:MAG: GIY-YIG nuclease family protein [Chitinophagaceae bacterium]
MVYKTYIIWSNSLQKFYVGSTNNLDDRVLRHNSGQGKFTSKGIPWILIWSYDCVDRKEAFNLEYKIKRRGIKRFLEDNRINLDN